MIEPQNESRSVHQFPRLDRGTVPVTTYLQHGTAHRLTCLVDCGCKECDCLTLTRDGQPCPKCAAGDHYVSEFVDPRVRNLLLIGFAVMVVVAVVIVHGRS